MLRSGSGPARPAAVHLTLVGQRRNVAHAIRNVALDEDEVAGLQGGAVGERQRVYRVAFALERQRWRETAAAPRRSASSRALYAASG